MIEASAFAWQKSLAAAAGTLVLEDPTAIACGLLVADGHMSFATALVGLAGGIAAGDWGLYLLGRAAGPRLLRWGLVSETRLTRASSTFRRGLVRTLVLSRFVPGLRLPTYIAAGVLRAPAWRFVTISALASIVWTLLLLTLATLIGESLETVFGALRWPIAALALLGLVLGQRRWVARRDGDSGEASGRTVSAFEYWPPWLFYLPVAGYYGWLALRYRGLLIPTCVNPSIHAGGLFGESKSAILDLVAAPERRWIAPYAALTRESGDAGLERTLEAAIGAVETRGLGWPIVAKPDIGQRGAGVQRVSGPAELRAYLARFPERARFILQTLVGTKQGPDHPATPWEPLAPRRWDTIREAGVLWRCEPGADRGNILSITLKRPAEVIGDGNRSLRELIRVDPRARKLASVFYRRHSERLDEIIGEGVRVPLAFAGNHCQGAIFFDGTALSTAALAERFEGIARSIPDFQFGRFDVRFDDFGAFLAGSEFQIVEVNGAGAEATHIWDASMTLGHAYAVLFDQYRELFAIGAANRRRGQRPLPIRRFLADLRSYRRLARAYPPSH